jgi:hypothetical protein
VEDLRPSSMEADEEDILGGTDEDEREEGEMREGGEVRASTMARKDAREGKTSGQSFCLRFPSTGEGRRAHARAVLTHPFCLPSIFFHVPTQYYRISTQSTIRVLHSTSPSSSLFSSPRTRAPLESKGSCPQAPPSPSPRSRPRYRPV